MGYYLRSIQFSDDVPYNPYFDGSPFSVLNDESRVTLALAIYEDRHGGDYWAQALLRFPEEGLDQDELSEGQMEVSSLERREIVSTVNEIISSCLDDLELEKYFVYEDGAS